MENSKIEAVVSLFGIQVIKRGTQNTAVCPFCGDKRGKFSYITVLGEKRDLYSCFHCGNKGSYVTLYKKLSGREDIKRSEVDKEIDLAIKHGEISFEQNAYSREECVERAPQTQISCVNKIIVSLLTLRDEHRKDLLRRGMTERDIVSFQFRSTPKSEDYFSFCDKLDAELKKRDISPVGIPGLYTKNGRLRVNFSSGYLCPVFHGGDIVGFQIRADQPINGAKYLWFSSEGKPGGTSPGAQATILKSKTHKEVVIITEGILKASVIYSLLNGEVSVVGVPGIMQIKTADRFLNTLKGNGYVYEAYDMEKVPTGGQAVQLEMARKEASEQGLDFSEAIYKKELDEKYHEALKSYRIACAAEKLRESVEERNLPCHSLTWDVKHGYWRNQYKGLDDFLLEYKDKSVFLDYILKKADDHIKLRRFLSEQ